MIRMHRLFTISEDTTAFPWSKRTPDSAAVATIAVGIALLAGWMSGHQGAGAIAAGAAFTVGFAVFHEALASWMLSMLAATLGIASATLIGSLAAPSTPLPIMTFRPFVAAAKVTAFSKIGIMRYLPPVLFASLSSIYGSR